MDQKLLELTKTCFFVQDQLVESLDKIPSSTATLVQCNCDNPDSIVMKALDNLQDVFNDGMNELEDRVGEAKTSTNRAIIEADVNQREELARILLKEIETYEIQVIDLKYYIVIKVMEWEREKRRGRSYAMEPTQNQSTQTEIEMESLLDENGCRFPMSHVEVSGNVDLAKTDIEAADREGIKLLSDDDHSDWFEEGPRATPEKGGDVDSVLDEEDPSATSPEKGDDVVRIHNKSTKSLTNILSNKGYIDD
ncbi:hypothetical protein BELL_1231g00010 [Botrytis elliptica]|uniref:Uncharacterized protein n=1 Tax=Botrytis elliptica TaxID=278938 RepID=A0A4Z1IE77_9HELO|nr:hypothetical protein BELL_1231g00010 [Botrytis elliptica]